MSSKSDAGRPPCGPVTKESKTSSLGTSSRRIVRLAAVIVTRALWFTKINLVSNYFSALAVVSVFVLPVPGLNGTDNNDHTTFSKPFCNKLGSSAPCNNIDKVGICLLISLTLIVSINCYGKACNCDIVLGETQFRSRVSLPIKTTLLSIPTPHSFTIMMERIIPSVIL